MTEYVDTLTASREACEHGTRHCSHCHPEADAQVARERWWSGGSGLLLPWYCRDEIRAASRLEPDGLWNGPTPCGATIVGVTAEEREAMEVRHRETCQHGCSAPAPPLADAPTSDAVVDGVLTLDAIRRAVAILQEDNIPKDANGYYQAPQRERHKPEQYPARGRWRRRKQVLRQLAADLGWPECMAVTHDDSIVGAVLQAGLRIRDWRRFERSGRRGHERHRLLRIAKPLQRWARRKLAASGELPF